MASEIGGVWRTVGGRRIFIKDGEDLASVMKESGKFNNKKKERQNITNDIKNKEKVELEPKWCEVSESFEPEIIPIPNAKPEEVEIIPIPNAKVEDVKIMPVKSIKKKTSKK